MSGTRPAQRSAQTLRLRVYVAGDSPNSVAAIRNLRALLDAHPTTKVELEILDVLRKPELGVRDGVLVTPMTIKLAPAPQRKIFGTLKDSDAVVAALGLSKGHRE